VKCSDARSRRDGVRLKVRRFRTVSPASAAASERTLPGAHRQRIYRGSAIASLSVARPAQASLGSSPNHITIPRISRAASVVGASPALLLCDRPRAVLTYPCRFPSLVFVLVVLIVVLGEVLSKGSVVPHSRDEFGLWPDA
jgi:hypothetical protein